MESNLPSYRLLTAGIILIVYFVIAGVLLYNLYHPPSNAAQAPVWDHVLTIFSAVGALATTAAGVLLGVEVQQPIVSAAIKDARIATAIAARKDGAVLEALALLEAVDGTVEAAAADPVARARNALQRSLTTSDIP